MLPTQLKNAGIVEEIGEHVAEIPFCPAFHDYAPEPIFFAELGEIESLGLMTNSERLVGLVGWWIRLRMSRSFIHTSSYTVEDQCFKRFSFIALYWSWPVF